MKTVKERYTHCVACTLNPIMMINDKRSYNDFKRIKFEDEKTSNRGQHKQAVKEAFVHRGHTDADAVVVGGFGAVPVTGDKNYEYYICRWARKPEKMTKKRHDLPWCQQGSCICVQRRLDLPWNLAGEPERRQELVDDDFQTVHFANTGGYPSTVAVAQAHQEQCVEEGHSQGGGCLGF